MASFGVQPESAAVAQASADDREWFDNHPDENVRYRSLIDGEFEGIPNARQRITPEHRWVVVTQIERGVRTREPVSIHIFDRLTGEMSLA